MRPTAPRDAAAPSPRGRRDAPIAAGYLLLLPLVVFAPGLRPGWAPIQTHELYRYAPWMQDGPHERDGSVGHPDIPNQVYPLERFARDTVRRGGTPFGWNPWVLCGTRNHYGSPSRSPAFWLPAWFLPLEHAHAVMLVLLLQMVGLFAWFWLRGLGITPLAAAFGAGGYALNLGFVAWSYPEILESCAWFPFVLGCLERYWRRGDSRWLAGAGLGAGMQLFAGHAQYALFAWVFTAAYVLLRAGSARCEGDASRPPGPLAARLAPLAPAAVGLAIGAVQLWPFLLFLPESHRGLLTKTNPIFYATPLDYASSFFNPMLPGPRSRWWYEVAGYVGWTALAMAGYAAWRPARAARARTRVLIVLGLLAAVAVYDNPLGRQLRRLPGFGIAELGRGSFLLALLLAGLAALGLERMLEKNPRRLSLRAWVLLMLAAAAAITAVHLGLLAWLRGRESVLEFPPGGAAEYFRAGNPLLWRPLGIGGIGLVLFAIWRLPRIPRRFWLALVLLVQALDVVSVGWVVSRPGRIDKLFAPGQWAEDLRAVTSDPPSRVVLVGPSKYSGNLLMPYRIESATGYSSAYDGRMRRWFDTTIGGVRTHENSVCVHMSLDGPDPMRALGLLNVRFLLASPLTASELDERFPSLRRVPRIGTPQARHAAARQAAGPARVLRVLPPGWPERLEIFENPACVPRVLRVPLAHRVGDADQALAAVVDPAFDPRSEVVIEGGPGAPGRVTRGEGAGEEGAASRKARVVRHEPNRVEIETEGAGAGWVVLLETWDAGWSATVNRRPAPALRANYLFRAVAVPAGRSTVVWRFELPGLRQGAWVSVLGVLAALAWLLLARAPHRRSLPAGGPAGRPAADPPEDPGPAPAREPWRELVP